MQINLCSKDKARSNLGGGGGGGGTPLFGLSAAEQGMVFMVLSLNFPIKRLEQGVFFGLEAFQGV